MKDIKPDNSTDKLYEQGAYHESGHIVIAYFYGYKCDEVRLLSNDPGAGFSRFDYSQDTVLVTSILNSQNNSTLFNSLPKETKMESPHVAYKVSNILLSGPVTEAFHKFGVDFVGNLEVDVNGPDLISVKNIDYFLTEIDKQHNPDFVQHSLGNIGNVLRTDQFWKAIEHLAKTIINSPSKSLTRFEIENSLNQSGFLAYLKTL